MASHLDGQVHKEDGSQQVAGHDGIIGLFAQEHSQGGGPIFSPIPDAGVDVFGKI